MDPRKEFGGKNSPREKSIRECAACQSERGGTEHPFSIGTGRSRNPINKFTFLQQKIVIKILVNNSTFLPHTS